MYKTEYKTLSSCESPNYFSRVAYRVSGRRYLISCRKKGLDNLSSVLQVHVFSSSLAFCSHVVYINFEECNFVCICECMSVCLSVNKYSVIYLVCSPLCVFVCVCVLRCICMEQVKHH